MEPITRIPGGVCAPQGFSAAGIHCGLAKKAEKKDLALIYSTVRCPAAAVYTQNKVKASPLVITRNHLVDGMAQAVICNSANANCCNADGEDIAEQMCAITADRLRIETADVLVASTGVIGKPLPIDPLASGIPAVVNALSTEGSADCAHAIMTTDTREKEVAVTFPLGNSTCKIGAIAKGSGMIHPNMGTMLAFITTDVFIASDMLQKALELVVADTFNMVSVDGDTSTNDMAVILANGAALNACIESEGEAFDTFVVALMHVCIYLARMMARDGEGATKLLECSVEGAPNDEVARVLAKSVMTSNLVKAAMFGSDANWGRVLCALGYADTEFDISKTEVRFVHEDQQVIVCQDGTGVPFSEDMAKAILNCDEIEIQIDLHQGDGSAVAWGCDLTYDYVKINGDYRT